jgi:hypothetical protein
MATRLFKDMSLAELRIELQVWDDQIRKAAGWGVDLPFAVQCREACAREIKRRENDAELTARKATPGR